MGRFLRSIIRSPILQNMAAALLLDFAARLSRRSSRAEEITSSQLPPD